MSINTITLLLVIALAVILYFALGKFDPAVQTVTGELADLEDYPNAFARNLKAQKFRVDGGLEFYFSATNVEYFQAQQNVRSANDYALVTTPTAAFFKRGKNQDNINTWLVIADSGKATKNLRTIELENNVKVWKPEVEGDYTEIETSHLTLDINSQFASTEELVNIRFPHTRSTAKGMEAQLQSEIFTLFDQITIHEPNE